MSETREGWFLISNEWNGPRLIGEITKETPHTWTIRRLEGLYVGNIERRKKRQGDFVVETVEEAKERIAAWEKVIADYKPAIDLLDGKARQLRWEQREFARAALTRMEPSFAFQRGERPKPIDAETFMHAVFDNGGRVPREPVADAG